MVPNHLHCFIIFGFALDFGFYRRIEVKLAKESIPQGAYNRHS